MNHWLWLSVAILFEVAGTSLMKLSNGLTRLWPTVAMFVCYGCAFACLSFALRTLPVGIAYAIWAGVGTALIAAIGVFAFEEPLSAIKVGGIVLIIAGVVALQLEGGH
ncbi:MAG: multidrug efflux SMR transporter [Gammaproteobacteria bacterium]|nr:multidrug efflux SMR transporter [Gammaproteobacteria bacterium]